MRYLLLITFIVIFAFLYIDKMLIRITYKNPKLTQLIRKLIVSLSGYRYIDDNVFFQKRANECGDACVRMILLKDGLVQKLDGLYDHRGILSMKVIVDFLYKYYDNVSGVQFNLPVNLEYFTDSCRDNMILLLRTSVTNKFYNRLYNLGGRNITVGHWCVLDSVSRNGIIIKDPTYGRIEIKNRSLGKIWDGHAIQTGKRKG